MEKLVYLLLGPHGTFSEETAVELKSSTVPALHDLGAHSCQLNVTDPALGDPFGVAPDDDSDQILAAVSVWVDSAEAVVGSIHRSLPAGGSERSAWHGWLVCESEPLRNLAHPPASDGLCAGFTQVVALIRPANLSWAEWRRVWQGGHTKVALNTQSTFRYVQNVVFRAVTPGAPSYAAVVEETFPIEATTDLHVFFDSVGDDAKLSRHMAAMSESCDRFMDGRAPVSWTRQWVYGGPPA